MSDILNQEEINALLEAYKSAGDESIVEKPTDKQVRLYDFTRPDKFSKEHLRSLNLIHSRHGASFAAALSSLIRTNCMVDLLALDQLTFREYCASVPDGTLFVEVNLEPLTANAIFEFNPLFVAGCVDMLAGGSSVSKQAPSEITEIDKAIMRTVVKVALKKYVEAWSSCVMLKPSITNMSTESSSRQTLLPTEPVLVSGYEVSVDEMVSMMSICIPASAIEAVLPALTLGRTLNSSSQRADRTSEVLKRSFEDVEVECHAVLGQTTLSLEEVMDLEVGDLIKLPTKRDGCAEFWIEDVPTYAGSLGLSGNNLALRIVKQISEDNMEH